MLIGLLGLALYFSIRAIVNLSVSKQVSGAAGASQNVTVSDNTSVFANPSVPAAQPASLTTRSGNTTGTLTMTNASFGIVTGQRLDVYWNGGQQYNVVAGSVSGLSVPISGGTGTNLPAANTAISVGIPTSAPFSVTGNNMQGLICTMNALPTGQVKGCYFVFDGPSGGDSFSAAVIPGTIYDWLNGYAVASNPLSNCTIGTIWMSHADTSAAHMDMQAIAVTH
jgi:hypothetical protein